MSHKILEMKGLDGVGVDFVIGVSQLSSVACEEVLLCQVKNHQNTNIHGIIEWQQAEVLEVLAHSHE